MDFANASRRLDGIAVTGVGGVATVIVAGGVLRIRKGVDPTLNSSQSVSVVRNHKSSGRMEILEPASLVHNAVWKEDTLLSLTTSRSLTFSLQIQP